MNNHDKEATFKKLLDNADFIGFITHGKNKSYWEKRISEDEEIKDLANKVKEFIPLINDLREDISEEDIRKLWKEIDAFLDRS